MNPDTRGLGLAPATAADYRELARPEDAEAYFAITPQTAVPANIISMKEAA